MSDGSANPTGIAREVLRWIAGHLAVILFGVLVVLQFLTWRATLDNKRPYVGRCDSQWDACHVEIDNPDELAKAIASRLSR